MVEGTLEHNIGGYNEEELTLEIGKKVKKELEVLGLKVKITRDGNEKAESYNTQTVYDEKGRINVTRKIKSKICNINSPK